MKSDKTLKTETIVGVAQPRLVVPLGNVSYGRSYTTGTLLAALIAADGDRSLALETLAWVTKEMGISGGEITHYQNQPDVSSDQWEEWSATCDSFLHNSVIRSPCGNDIRQRATLEKLPEVFELTRF